ncbi:MobF family relaxase [Tsukamurella paurometabola]|nr:MobF family relaxase [Tsukamurella paurometabola]
MTIHVLHAGDGYTYLTRNTASGDRVREGRDQLSAYYLEGGTPPGRWHGRGLAALAAHSPASEHATGPVAGQVTEAQMKALFGEGLHPDADAMMKAGASVKDVKLGNKFPVFANEIPVLVAFNTAVKEHEREHGAAPSKEVRDALWKQVARTEFERANPNEPGADDKRVLAWAAKEKGKVRQPVAGYDLTFTPVKSVSVMWALADPETRAKIETAHQAAVGDALSWLEDNAVFTKRGARGEQQLSTAGLTVAQFDHYDTRAGDPNLHTHCAVSNKVLGSDGRWGAINSLPFFNNAVAASQRYNAVLAETLRAELGVEFVARQVGRGKQPIMEIAGIDTALLDGFSTRRAQVRARHEQLLAQYIADHGHTPGKHAEYALFQQATLETREGKDVGPEGSGSLGKQLTAWQSKARALAPEQAQGEQLLAQCRIAGREALAAISNDPDAAPDRAWHGPAAAAEEVLHKVCEQRSVWRETHLRTAAEAIIAAKLLPSGSDRRELVDTVVERALAESMIVGPGHELLDTTTGEIPERLRRDNGEHVLTNPGGPLLTSSRIVDAENTILDAAATPTAHVATNAVIDAGIASVEENEPFPLNAGQAELVRHFCGSGALVAAGVGPAGTGKTTSMKATVAAWTADANRLPGAAVNRQVIPLAPSAVAATKLGDEIELTGNTIDSFTYWWTAMGGRETYLTAHQVLADPDAGFLARRDARDALKRCPTGAMYLVDEAGMASTRNLAIMVDIAEQTGGVVRFLGDPYQLDAVTTGGAFAMLARATDAPELTDVVRFGTDTQQAENSLALRAGDEAALDLYEQRGWTHHHNTAGEAIDEMVAAHLADTASGRNSIVLASTREEVAAINAQIQAHHRSGGRAQAGRTVDLSDGLAAGVGDRIVTRDNDSDYRQIGGKRANSRVLNGDLWNVEKIHSDGSLTARHIEDGGRIHLPASYLTANT